MAKTVSIINMKGGVGKSTLTVNLAWHFAAAYRWSKRVLVVDLDPQFNSSQYLLGVSEYEKLLHGKGTFISDVFEWPEHVFKREDVLPLISDIVIHPVTSRYGSRSIYGEGKIDLLPSKLELALSLRNPVSKEGRLSAILSNLKEKYDLILIDCAPTESLLTTAAYLSSDFLFVPVKPEYLSAIGLNLLVSSMNNFNSEYAGHDLHLAGIVFNAASDYLPEEGRAKADVRAIASKNNWYVFESEVPYSRSFPKGAREGQPIFRTSYARSSQTERFEEVAREFAKRIEL